MSADGPHGVWAEVVNTLAADGVWVETEPGVLEFHRVRGPTDEDLERLADLVVRRVRLLVDRGLWKDDEDGGVPTSVRMPGGWRAVREMRSS